MSRRITYARPNGADRSTVTEEAAGPTLIRWGAVFAGAVLGLALLAVLSALWLALAYGSEVESVRDNLEWYVAASAIVSLFVAGMLAGYLSGVRSATTGLFHGLTMWGLLLIGTLAIGVPSVLNLFSLGRVQQAADAQGLLAPGVDASLWASFWSILGGLAAAGLGGILGGMMSRGTFDLDTRGEIEEDRTDLGGERRVS